MSKAFKKILNVAEMLSNPMGTASSFFKPKGLKKGRAPASAGLVRRKYKKRSQARAPPSIIANDGNGNLTFAKKIGNQPKQLSSYLQSQIRDMLNPANHHVIQNTGNVNIENGQCVYTHYEMMNGTDIDQVIAQANGKTEATQNINGKLNIQNAKLTVHLRNQTTNLVYLTVYDYVCRRDLPDEIQITPGSATEVDATTQAVIETGFNYQATAQVQSNSLGGTLFQNPMFCTYYKITRVRKLMLGAGKNLNFSLSNLKARVINPLIYNATDGDVLAGLTRGFVIQASGGLVGPTGEFRHNQPTTGLINFDWFCSRKYAYNQPWSGEARNTFQSNLPTDNQPWYHINEYTGVAQEEKEA